MVCVLLCSSWTSKNSQSRIYRVLWEWCRSIQCDTRDVRVHNIMGHSCCQHHLRELGFELSACVIIWGQVDMITFLQQFVDLSFMGCDRKVSAIIFFYSTSLLSCVRVSVLDARPHRGLIMAIDFECRERTNTHHVGRLLPIYNWRTYIQVRGMNFQLSA